MKIGVISDTHGLLRPEAVAALRGVDHILHLGDVGDPSIGDPSIGDPSILGRLRELAPTTAIRGNVDTHGPCALLPETEVVEFEGQSLYLLHNLDHLDLKPKAAGFAAVLYGHTHQPKIDVKDGVLYFNPGSAGPRRFKLPVSLGFLSIADATLNYELRQLM
jgi:putative phosphoesterase